MTVEKVDRIASALGGSLLLEMRWNGEQLDRLIDAAHAVVADRAVAALRAAGWMSEVEVSFNWYGDRGRCDAVAFHPESRTLLIVEAKTRIGDVQDLLGRLAIKVRLGPHIARQLGRAEPARVIPCLVIADSRTARRIVAAHAALFAHFNLRGRAALRWLGDPQPDPSVRGVLVFESLSDSRRATVRRRVRVAMPVDARQA